MSEGNWYDAYLAPGIVIGSAIAIVGWLRSYLAGKKSNVREAKELEDKTIEKAKRIENEKIEAAEALEDKRKLEATEVKREGREHLDIKLKFSDQEHLHQHAELINKLKELNTKIEQVSIDLKLFMKQQDDENETCKRRHVNGDSR